MSESGGREGVEMEQALLEAPDGEQDAAKVVGEGREVVRSVLGLAAVKALELSDQAAEKAQQLARRRRRRGGCCRTGSGRRSRR